MNIHSKNKEDKNIPPFPPKNKVITDKTLDEDAMLIFYYYNLTLKTISETMTTYNNKHNNKKREGKTYTVATRAIDWYMLKVFEKMGLTITRIYTVNESPTMLIELVVDVNDKDDWIIAMR